MKRNELIFRQVDATDKKAIEMIYQILCRCGEDMYQKQGLTHWKTPYSMDLIRQNCIHNAVFVVEMAQEIIATFQIAYDLAKAHMSKAAVAPEWEGRGIGSECLQYIYQRCSEKGIAAVYAEVYDKNTHAVSFYLKNGFKLVGTDTGKRFTVYIVEKRMP